MTRRRLVAPLGAIVTVIALVAGVLAQTAPDRQLPAGAISGTVVNATTGDRVPGAVVLLSASPPNKAVRDLRQIADETGRFVFVNVTAPGSYTIAASKSGYLDGGYGRERAPSDPLGVVNLAGGAWAGNLTVPLWQPSSISGVVRDEVGEPVVGVYVRALAMVRLLGRQEVAAGQMTLTDDRGAYRLTGLTPGRYVVQVPSVPATVHPAATLRAQAGDLADGGVDLDNTTRLVIGRFPLPPPAAGGRAMTYPPAFHGASSIAQATPIELGFSEERSNVDVTLAPVPSVRVSGVVEAPDPQAWRFLTVRLLPTGLESLGQGAEVATALVADDGRFAFVNVPSGSYTIDAPMRISELQLMPLASRMYFPPPAGRQGWSRTTDTIDLVPGLTFVATDYRAGAGGNFTGRAPVTVGAADVTNVVLRLRAGGSMTGHFVLERDPSREAGPAPHTVTISLDPATGESHFGMPRPRQPLAADESSFTIQNVLAGRYWLRALVQTEAAFSDTAVITAANRLATTPGWLVKSVTWNGRNYADEPFDATQATEFTGVVVTLTDAVPELTGTVRATPELPRDRAMVIAFPVNPDRWRDAGLRPDRLKTAVVSSAGTYRFVNLPAGDYFVAGVDRAHMNSGAWRDPGFLIRAQRAASRVTLRWGATTSQDVDVVVIR